jgi:hypothetical protein
MNTGDSVGDLELIAALIDGRLQGEERARAIRLLADSDASLEVFANALRAQPADQPVVIPLRARRGPAWRVAVPLAAAAVLAIAVIPAVMRLRSPEPSSSQLVAALVQNPRFTSSLGDDWPDRSWRVARGAVPSPELSPGAREAALAFRLGVRAIDLRVAMTTANLPAARQLATEMVQQLGDVRFADSLVATYRSLAGDLETDPPGQALDRAARAERDLGAFLDSPSFVLGRWAGAAELAARAGDAAFLESRDTRRLVRWAIERGELTPEEAHAIEPMVVRRTAAWSDTEFQRLRELLQRIIRRQAG